MFDNIYVKRKDAEFIISDENCKKAITLLEKRIAKGEKTAFNFAALSKAYLLSKDYDKSLEYAKESIKTEPDYVYGLARCAFAYAPKKDIKNTRKYFDLALEHAKDNMFIIALLGKIMSHSDELGALYADKLLKITPKTKDSDYYCKNAMVYDFQSKYKKMIECAKQMIKCAPDDYFGYEVISYGYAELKDLKNTLKYADKLLKVKPSSRQGYERRCGALLALKKYDLALEVLLKEKNLGYSADYDSMSLCYLNTGDYNNALKYAEKAIAAEPENAAVYSTKGLALDALEKYDLALEAYIEAEKLGGGDSTIYVCMSWCYYEADDYMNALKYANKAINTNKKNFYAYFSKGVIWIDRKLNYK
jgi:tetratricopeptide (TPR) repeat protein